MYTNGGMPEMRLEIWRFCSLIFQIECELYRGDNHGNRSGM